MEPGGQVTSLLDAPLLVPVAVAPGRSVAERSAPIRSTDTLRQLARAGLREAGEALATDGAGIDPQWYSSLRVAQGQLRLLRPIIEPNWNDHARFVLRAANTALTDLDVIAALLEADGAIDRAATERLHDHSMASGLAVHRLSRGTCWMGVTDAMRRGGWPVRTSRFELDEPAVDYLPGQLLPLFKKLEHLDGQLHDDLAMRLAAKTAQRLVTGFEMLARSGVGVALDAAAGCRAIVDELAPAVACSRATELLTQLGLPTELARPLAPPDDHHLECVGRHLRGENLIRTPKSAKPVAAAGGVVWRRVDGRLEVVLVSRHRQRDWSLPKGKQSVEETPIECALRETFEETGLVCQAGDELLDASYRDRAGRTKHVRYWALSPIGGELRPDHEIGEVRWVELQEAIRTVTKHRERHVLASLTVVAESVA